MRYVVKCEAGDLSLVQVVAQDVHHAIEAARIMMDQGLRDIVVQDIVAGQEAAVTDFFVAHGFEDGAGMRIVMDRPQRPQT